MVYPNTNICSIMDVDVYMDIIKCLYCGIPKEELYMGGGSYAYKCPRCGDKTEVMK